MLLFIFPKNEVDILKSVKMHYKNLVLVIFFFTVHQKEKIPFERWFQG